MYKEIYMLCVYINKISRECARVWLENNALISIAREVNPLRQNKLT